MCHNLYIIMYLQNIFELKNVYLIVFNFLIYNYFYIQVIFKYLKIILKNIISKNMKKYNFILGNIIQYINFHNIIFFLIFKIFCYK